MNKLTLEEIGRRMDLLQEQIAHVIRVLEERPERAFADVDNSMTVQVTEAAKMLRVERKKVYELHRAGKLHGFRPHPRARLKFLASDIRAYAVISRDQRQDG